MINAASKKLRYKTQLEYETQKKIWDCPDFFGIDDSIVRKLTKILLKNKDIEKTYKFLLDTYPEIDISIERFKEICNVIIIYTEEIKNNIAAIMTDNDMRAQENDHVQFTVNTPPKNIDFYEQNGIHVTMSPKQKVELNKLKESFPFQNKIPIVELVKTDLLVDAGHFKDSKILHLFHDTLDHVWLFRFLENTGVFQRHQDFFKKIGDPQVNNIFRREGELVASVGFGFRRSQTLSPSFKPIIEIGKIRKILNKYKQSENTKNVLMQLEEMDESQKQLVEKIISNMAMQIPDERRRFGHIKKREGEKEKPMRLLDGEYITFIVDAISELIKAEKEFIRAEEVFSSHVERFLEQSLDGESTDFIIKPDKFHETDNEISEHKKNWFHGHRGFSTIYESVASSQYNPEKNIINNEKIEEMVQFARENNHQICTDLLIINESGEILIHQRASNKRLFPLCWEPVGGHVEQGETVQDCIRREIYEESGLRLEKIIDIIGMFEWENSEGKKYTNIQLMGTAIGKPRIEDGEAIAMKWISEQEIDILLENRLGAESPHYAIFQEAFKRIKEWKK